MKKDLLVVTMTEYQILVPTDLTPEEIEMFWNPPPDHDISAEAIAARLVAGEESDRRYEIRREALRELEEDEYGPEKEDDGEG